MAKQTLGMGFFGTYEYTQAGWSPGDPDAGPSETEPRLWLDIHASDFATVAYAPSGPGSGVAYLGYSPRVYFETDEASEPTNPAREALGLATWVAALQPQVDIESKQAAIATFLAGDEAPNEEVDSDDDADVFVSSRLSELSTLQRRSGYSVATRGVSASRGVAPGTCRPTPTPSGPSRP